MNIINKYLNKKIIFSLMGILLLGCHQCGLAAKIGLHLTCQDEHVFYIENLANSPSKDTLNTVREWLRDLHCYDNILIENFNFSVVLEAFVGFLLKTKTTHLLGVRLEFHNCTINDEKEGMVMAQMVFERKYLQPTVVFRQCTFS